MSNEKFPLNKKIKIVIEQDVKASSGNLQQVISTGAPSTVHMDDKDQLEGTELFSFFTANIIKEEKVFTR